MAAILLQTIPSFYTKVSEKNSLYFRKYNYEKYFVCEDYCIAHQHNRLCFLPEGKFHVILLGNIEELLKKLNKFCFTYQHVDCLYLLFKYRFIEKVIGKSGQVSDNVQRSLDFNHRNMRVIRRPSIAKRDSCGKS